MKSLTRKPRPTFRHSLTQAALIETPAEEEQPAAPAAQGRPARRREPISERELNAGRFQAAMIHPVLLFNVCFAFSFAPILGLCISLWNNKRSR